MTFERYPTQIERSVERIRLLDLDRHILNTETFHILMREAAWEEAGIRPEVLNAFKEEKEQSGQTLHTDEIIYQILVERDDRDRNAGLVPEKTPDQQLQAVFTWMREMSEYDDVREAFFLPGAEEFIHDLEATGAFDRGEAAFLTWGTDPLQLLKLKCLRLDKHPHQIIQEREKGAYIAKSRNDAGKYVFTMRNGWKITADTVELYDDKASSFNGLPSEEEGVRGFWKLPENQEVLPSQRGKVPENVVAVDSFPIVRHIGDLAISTKS